MSDACATDALAPTKARAWLLAARPATLTVALSAVLVGAATSFRSGHLRVDAVFAALLSAVFIQVGTNLANDVFDAEKGADTHERIGPLRVVQAGLLSGRAVKVVMVATFVLAALAGAYLVALGGWTVAAIGIASIASGIAYTGGPWPLGYHGLGDVFVFAFFGPIAVCGTAFVTGGSVSGIAAVSSISIGALSTAVLVVNNVRDHATDRVAKKRTLVVRFGRAFGIGEYAALLVIAYALPCVLAVAYRTPVLALPLLTAPLAIRLAKCVRSETDGASLNAALAGTARTLLGFSVLMAVGIGAS